MDKKDFMMATLVLSTGLLAAQVQQSPGTAQQRNRPRAAPQQTASNKIRQNYIGDNACVSCHAEKAESYFHTAHHLTSRFPNKASISGSFAEGNNILKTANSSLLFRMESKPDGFYQSAVWQISSVTSARTERMDVVIGSGRKGQTYLYWKSGHLYQLPVSYWVDLESWVNSPGYRDGVSDFDRPVIPRCLECHATYAQTVAGPPPPNQYKPASLVVGISCERCHGPGREHAEAMQANKTPAAIVNPAKLPRERQIEVCAQCHAGHGKSLTAAFSYIPDEPLDRYLQRDQPAPGSTVDVHGNQVALLQLSRCFQSSPELTCSTCHDVHTIQREAASFSNRCLTCHKIQNCGEFAKLGEKLAANCIDCHMPLQASNLIMSDSNGKQTKAVVRNHWIKVYPGTGTP
jgi:cytochrome c554/c'-like protein